MNRPVVAADRRCRARRKDEGARNGNDERIQIALIEEEPDRALEGRVRRAEDEHGRVREPERDGAADGDRGSDGSGALACVRIASAREETDSKDDEGDNRGTHVLDLETSRPSAFAGAPTAC